MPQPPYLEYTVVNGKQRDIEGTASEIKYEDVLLSLLLVETVSDGCGCGLVDNSHHVQSGDGTGILSGLTLGIVKVGWYCHNSMGYL